MRNIGENPCNERKKVSLNERRITSKSSEIQINTPTSPPPHPTSPHLIPTSPPSPPYPTSPPPTPHSYPSKKKTQTEDMCLMKKEISQVRKLTKDRAESRRLLIFGLKCLNFMMSSNIFFIMLDLDDILSFSFMTMANHL